MRGARRVWRFAAGVGLLAALGCSPTSCGGDLTFTPAVNASGDVSDGDDVWWDLSADPGPDFGAPDPGPDPDPGFQCHDCCEPNFDPGECGFECCCPFCKPGWVCGPDGCGGVCGPGCGSGLVCNNAKHVCEESGPAGKYFGEACGRTTSCSPQLGADPDGADNPAWPDCLHDQCELGVCLEPACSKACTLTKDQLDRAGQALPDGIDDVDAAFNDCAGAFDGPMGDTHRCVMIEPELRGPVWCLPGTDFAPCTRSEDCPDGESCQLMFHIGEHSTRCMTAPKSGVEVEAPCSLLTDDVEPGARCASRSCQPWGCSAVCASDEDCGAGRCLELPILGPDATEFTLPFCVPALCTTSNGCAEGQVCASDPPPVFSAFRGEPPFVEIPVPDEHGLCMWAGE